MGSRPCKSSFAMAQLDPGLFLSLSYPEKSGDVDGWFGSPVRQVPRPPTAFLLPTQIMLRATTDRPTDGVEERGDEGEGRE